MNEELEKVIGGLLTKLPGVKRKAAFGHSSFTVKEKVFAFIQKDAMVVKLPAGRIAVLIKSRKAEPLIMGKRTMKEWAVLSRSSPAAFKKELSLFKASLEFVRSGK